MDQKVFEFVKEQIAYLKQSLADETPVGQILWNCDSELQPQGVADVVKHREATRQQIIALLSRLLDAETKVDDTGFYQQLLENAVNDRDVAVRAIENIREMWNCNQDEDNLDHMIDGISKTVDQYYKVKGATIESLLNR